MMILYKYRGLDHHGRFLKGYVCASSKKDFSSALLNQNIQILSAYKTWRPGIQAREISLFFLYLSYTLQAGHPLSSALGVVSKNFKGLFSNIIQNIRQDLGCGKLFSCACKPYGDIFGPEVLALLNVGEKTGRLGEIFHQIHLHIQKQSQQKQNLIKSMAYPLFSFAMFFVFFIFLTQSLLPPVIQILEEQGKPLPLSTQFLSSFLKFSLGHLLFLSGFLGALAGPWRQKIIFYLLGKWILLPHYFSMISSLTLLTRSHCTLLQALVITQEALRHPILKKSVKELIQRIQEGKTLGQSVQVLPHFPNFYKQLLQIGEGTGQQIQALYSLHIIMEQDIQRILHHITTWSGPMILLLTALGVGFVLQGTILPIYHLGEGIF